MQTFRSHRVRCARDGTHVTATTLTSTLAMSVVLLCTALPESVSALPPPDVVINIVSDSGNRSR